MAFRVNFETLRWQNGKIPFKILGVRALSTLTKFVHTHMAQNGEKHSTGSSEAVRKKLISSNLLNMKVSL